MIDHVGLHVSSLEDSKRFYERALAPLGYETKFEAGEFVGMGAGDSMDLGLIRRDPVAGGHVAFASPDRPTVDAFYEAAIAAGGRGNGAPGLRPQYHEHYYAAYVLDPDGHNIEAVCQKPA